MPRKTKVDARDAFDDVMDDTEPQDEPKAEAEPEPDETPEPEPKAEEPDTEPKAETDGEPDAEPEPEPETLEELRERLKAEQKAREKTQRSMKRRIDRITERSRSQQEQFLEQLSRLREQAKQATQPQEKVKVKDFEYAEDGSIQIDPRLLQQQQQAQPQQQVDPQVQAQLEAEWARRAQEARYVENRERVLNRYDDDTQEVVEDVLDRAEAASQWLRSELESLPPTKLQGITSPEQLTALIKAEALDEDMTEQFGELDVDLLVELNVRPDDARLLRRFVKKHVAPSSAKAEPEPDETDVTEAQRKATSKPRAVGKKGSGRTRPQTRVEEFAEMSFDDILKMSDDEFEAVKAEFKGRAA